MSAVYTSSSVSASAASVGPVTISSRNGVINLSGTWSGTVNLQASPNNGVTWMTIKAYTANPDTAESFDNVGAGWSYRAYTPAWTSGTATVELAGAL